MTSKERIREKNLKLWDVQERIANLILNFDKSKNTYHAFTEYEVLQILQESYKIIVNTKSI